MGTPQQRTPRERTRRRFLKTGVATLATGLAASTAGCSTALPPLGTRQSYGRVDAPPADAPTYRRWLPAPTGESGGDAGYSFHYAEPGPVDGGEPEEFLVRRALTEIDLDYVGVGFENYEFLLGCEFGTVVGAEFDAASVVETVTASGYGPDGSYRGYDLFARSDVPRRVAVGDEVILSSSQSADPDPDLEALIDAGAGERERYHEASDAVERVTDAIGASRLVIGGPEFGDPTDRAAFAADGFRFDDDAAYQVFKLWFPADRVPTTDVLERAFRDEYGLTEEADTFDVSVDGQIGTLETRVPRGEPRDLGPMLDPPQVTWGAAYDADARTVTLRHEAGDPVDADLLYYDVDTETSPGEVEKRPLWQGARRVGPGDAAEIDLSDRPDVTDVNLVLSPVSGCCEYRMLFQYELPEGDR